MFDINTAIMRCLVKCLAMFGLGTYIYAGEDLPEASKEEEELRKYKFGVLKSLGDKPEDIVFLAFENIEGATTKETGRKGLADLIQQVNSKEKLENIGKHIDKMIADSAKINRFKRKIWLENCLTIQV